MPTLLAVLTFLIVVFVVLWIVGVGQSGSSNPAERKNIYEQQEANRRKTWMGVAGFIVFFLFLGLGFDFFYLGYSPWAGSERSEVALPVETAPEVDWPSTRPRQD